MKLIQCHIENFGKLKNQTISFSAGCQCFYSENGWGKSTLTAFLKVMFYGFDNERSRDDYVNERKRYRPWQGGVYGGSLTFEINDKRYTVERTFGLKEKEDTFILRDDRTNLESKDYTSNIGEEIFHLDSGSFDKTILLSQNDCATKTTDYIQAKLGNLSEATDDVKRYEKADSRLNDLLNAMSPLRKTGSLYRLNEQIADLEADLRRGDPLEKEIESLLEEKRRLEEDYIKYKTVQEELLERQREISIQTEIEPGMAERYFDREARPARWPKWFLAAGIFCVIFGIVLLPKNMFGGTLLLAAGFLLLVTGLFQYRKQQLHFQTKKEEWNASFYEYKKKQLEEVQQRLRKIQIMIENTYRKIVHLEREIQDKLKKRDRFAEKEEQLIYLKEQYDADYVKYERLKMTREYLAKAKAVYCAKYRSPLMQSFSRYYEMISGERADLCRMDTNMEVTVQEYGHQRETRYFSAGWKDLMGICMRMALVDSMYQGEKPFLIMDDPFVNLDQKKMEAALEFLRELGEEYQVLYFTCHESRAV